ncbi:molecular chaperone [Salmonella enterica]|uniref:Molecular chaperone n=5 Tax=Salmonella enterica TaxID=28901 RepID=A0A5V2DV70_SALER|nr:molecular chaperone [Salmonella enterica]EAA7680369.1 molecular chaperone [Salmonella enterica subsp. houtenae]EBS4770822.1 molecular chaperone [Salmonella enterica subsp. enterica serovar Sandiego]EBX7643468.1 molecular chaperone [Salmonella enterica subsp. enterica serovar Saintpaul]EBZ5931335.1 molecular chaperone [Salmonella enterica subsp. enterica serovar Weslaco]ECH8236366.1 molecular chaperone [Salmonella enterica subsp. enterica]ECI0114320.1 molecular chaperone [Salmonella enteric
MKRLFYLVVLFVAYSVQAVAANGGFYLGQTRVVFPSDKKSVSLQVTNQDAKKDWLLRSWVSQYDDKNKSSTPFIITPPLYRLDGNNSIQLRINAVDVSKLPTDRESVFRINVMAIPPETAAAAKPEKEGTATGSIQFALNSRIKLFFRPVALNSPEQAEKAWEKVTVRQQEGKIIFNNPTPYYITLTNIDVNGVGLKSEQADTMIAPEGELTLPVSGKTRTLTFQTINDYGGLTKKKTVAF